MVTSEVTKARHRLQSVHIHIDRARTITVYIAQLELREFGVASTSRKSPGLLALVGVPIALVVIALTIIGIPFSLVGGLLFVVVAWVALVYGQFAFGSWLLSLAGLGDRWMGLVAGLLLVGLASPVPVAGDVVVLVMVLLGFGGLTLGLWGRRHGEGPAREKPSA